MLVFISDHAGDYFQEDLCNIVIKLRHLEKAYQRRTATILRPRNPALIELFGNYRCLKQEHPKTPTTTSKVAVFE